MVNVAGLADSFAARFPGSRPVLIARAPGRVNLIGEHVDYNDGRVLPAAIERATYAVFGHGRLDRIEAYSAALDRRVEIDLRDNPPPNPPTWDAYIRGVARYVMEAGVPVAGANVYIESDLPFGGGLSSSAALEAAVAIGLLALADASLPVEQMARVCRQAEHEYARVPCGIMDQAACLSATAGHVMLLDCRDLSRRDIAWPAGDACILIVDSREEHRLVDSSYAQRVDECRRAVEQLRSVYPDARSLRDVPPTRLVAAAERMDPLLLRRATHVVTEILRVDDAAAALERGDLDRLGALMNQSHESLRDQYEVSSPQLDELARLLRDTPAVYGARMTGGGFGGCVVAVVQRAGLPHIENVIRRCYDAGRERPARLLVTRPAAGASVTRLDGR